MAHLVTDLHRVLLMRWKKDQSKKLWVKVVWKKQQGMCSRELEDTHIRRVGHGQ